MTHGEKPVTNLCSSEFKLVPLQRGDLAAIKFNFGDLKNDSSMYFASSMDGEVALCDFTKAGAVQAESSCDP